MLYKKPCLCCSDDVWGRKNRLYHPACKTIANNEIAGLKRQAIAPLVKEFKKKFVPLPESLKFNDKIEIITAAVGTAIPTPSLAHSSGIEEKVRETIGNEEIPSSKPKSRKWKPVYIVGGLLIAGVIAGVVIYLVRDAKKEKEKQAELSN
ncbi:MAG: hypothetical protein HZB42_08045 [Sphingobacteriales bacterium]|nr:hypothetical protein [Sphingobacteriales bacterium]